MIPDLAVIEEPAQAAALLDPVRAQVLEHLRNPDSAAGAARALRLPRQRIGYHVRELERAGLLRPVGERRRRNYVERLLQATAKRYLISPAALGPGAPSLDAVRDRFSSEYLVATAARVVQDVGTLQRLAANAGKSLPTLTIESEVRFASPAAQSAFASELADAIARVITKYHDSNALNGRSFRLIAAAHPMLPPSTPPSPTSDADTNA